MPVLLILVVAAVVELSALIAVGKAIGVLATIGLLLLGSIVGVALLRREGSRTIAAFNEAVRTRRPPHRELADGVLIAAAGVLIVLPGFVSDVLGLLLLLPPVRALARHRMMRSAAKRTPFPAGGLGRGATWGGGRRAGGDVIDGEVVEGPVYDDGQAPPSGRAGEGPVAGGVIEGEVVAEHSDPRATPGERS